MSIELEFPAGTSKKKIAEAEKEYRKDALAKAFGWSREEFDENLERVKDFLTREHKLKRRTV